MPPGLWVQEGACRGYWFILPAAEVVLGRDLGADIPVADTEASRRHAAILPDGDRYRIRDLGSRNGIRVNGIPESDRVLEDGDQIRIGRTRFVFRTCPPPMRAADAIALAPRGSTPADPTASADGEALLAAGTDGIRLTDVPAPGSDLVGESVAMKEIYAWIRRAAPVDAPVLLLGETGTGKELVARAIHRSGPRRRGPFVALNCAAVPAELFESELFGHARGAFTGAVTGRKGLLELAEGGTLFLDEIGECPAEAQAKLLRALDTREVLPVGAQAPLRVDFRLVSATHRDLPAAVEAGRFRQDLYYRLRVLEIALPPLRERAEEVRQLAEHFLEEFAAGSPGVRGFAPEALDLLRRYRWPGNVRELRNAVERAVLVAGGATIVPEDLPFEIRTLAAEPADSTLLREVERRHILRVLRLADGNKTRAAAMLGIDRGTLYNKLREYGL